MPEHKFIILINNEYCFDSQCVSKEYYRDLMKGEEVDPFDYEMYDIYGDVAIGIMLADSAEEAISLVAGERLDPEMLTAHQIIERWE